MIRGYW